MCTAWERARWSVWDDDAALLPRNYIDAAHRAGAGAQRFRWRRKTGRGR